MKIIEIKKLKNGICKCQNYSSNNNDNDNDNYNDNDNNNNKQLKQIDKTQGWPWQLSLRNVWDKAFSTISKTEIMCKNLFYTIYCPDREIQKGLIQLRCDLSIYSPKNYNFPHKFSVEIQIQEMSKVFVFEDGCEFYFSSC